MWLIVINRLTALQKSFSYVDLVLKKHLLLSVKTVVPLNIFVWTIKHLSKLKEQDLIEIEVFCNIINVFTVTFSQFNVFAE